MIIKLLTGHHLEFLSLKGGCKGLSESNFFKMPYCWKSHVAAQILSAIRLIPGPTFFDLQKLISRCYEIIVPG